MFQLGNWTRQTKSPAKGKRRPRRSTLACEQLETRLMPTVDLLGSYAGVNDPVPGNAASTLLAVGPEHMIQSNKSQFSVIDKDTGAVLASHNAAQFFGLSDTSFAGLNAFQVKYDEDVQRFILMGAEKHTLPWNPHVSRIRLAVSNDANPLNGFAEMQTIDVLQVKNGQELFAQSLMFGWNGDAYVASLDMRNASGTFEHVQIVSIAKSSVLDHDPATLTKYAANMGRNCYDMAPATMHGAAPGSAMYFIGHAPGYGEGDLSARTTVRFQRMTNVLSATPTFSAVNLTVNSYAPAVMETAPLYNNPGLFGYSSFGFGSVDWRNDRFVSAETIAAPGSTTHGQVRWYEISTAGGTPTVLQQGDIQFTGPSGLAMDTYDPAITIKPNGSIGMSFEASSASDYISMHVTGRTAADAPGTMATPVRVKAGQDIFSTYILGAISFNSGIGVDPTDGTIWTSAAYVKPLINPIPQFPRFNQAVWIQHFDVTSPNQAPTIAVPASATPSPVAGTSTNLSVLAADDGGEANLTYTWSLLSGPGSVFYSANGSNAAKNSTATFTQAGNYTFRVTATDAGGLSVTSQVGITVNQTLTSISLSPPSVALNSGGTQQFSATGRDQFGNTLAAQSDFTWSLGSGSVGSVSSSGLYAAPTTGGGAATVRATSGSVVGAASVTVNAVNQAPTVASPAAATPSPVTGFSTNLGVLGADDGGEANLRYNWQVIGGPAGVTFSANGSNAAKNSTATFAQAGTYAFRATITDGSGLSASSDVIVAVAQTLTSIAVAPASVALSNGATQQFAATARDQFGNALTTPPAFTWSVVSGGVGTVNGAGLYTAPASGAGSATVRATSGSVHGSASVTVTAPTSSNWFDFGTGTSPVAPGAVNVSSQAFNATLGFGWAKNAAGLDSRDRGTVDPLTRDFVFGRDGTFLVNLANGTYTVTATIGDAIVAHDNVGIWIQGQQVASGLTTQAGQFVQQSFTATVTNGQLSFRMADQGGFDDYFVLNGLQITSSSTGQPPAAPVGLTAAAGNAQVSLSWATSVGASSYNVYRGTSSGAAVLLQSGLTAPSFTNTGLSNGTTYYYQVTAVNASGESGRSGEVSATPAPASAYSLFDFGTGTSPVATGATNVSAQAFNANLGYGWANNAAGLDSRDRGGADPLTRDFVFGRDGTFLVNLANGTYTVTATIGDAFVAHDNVGIWIQGQQVASGLTTQAGQVLQQSFAVTVTNGQLNFRIADQGGYDDNFVLNGLQITAQAATSATFVGTDATTQGSWRNAYGTQGYQIIGDTTSLPSYATVTPAGKSDYTWAGSSADVRALQKAAATDRLASCWYSGGSFTVDVRITDGQAHKVSLYMLDWDGAGSRQQRIEVLDAATGRVLDSRDLSSFQGGKYLSWNVAGAVTFRITNLNSNAVLSGVFVDAANS